MDTGGTPAPAISFQFALAPAGVSAGSGEKIINNDHRREKGQPIQELEEQFYNHLTGASEQARQLVAAIRQDKPRYIRDQLVLLIQTVQQCHPDMARQALFYCLQAGIKGAADFKSVVQHFCDHANEKQEPSVHLNPLNRKTPIEALIQPHTSSIDDYDMF